MSKGKKVLVAIACVLGAVLVVIASALSRGYFDRGHFQIIETSKSSSARVAMVAERSDHEAMSSYVYFVLIGDHVFSPRELRDAYYGDAVIFAVASDCLTIRWSYPQNLTIMCREGSIDPSHIEVQLRQAGSVAITYMNIPYKNSSER